MVSSVSRSKSSDAPKPKSDDTSKKTSVADETRASGATTSKTRPTTAEDARSNDDDRGSERNARRPTASSAHDARVVAAADPTTRQLRERLEARLAAERAADDARAVTLAQARRASLTAAAADLAPLTQTILGNASPAGATTVPVAQAIPLQSVPGQASPPQQGQPPLTQEQIDAIVDHGTHFGTRALANALRDPEFPPGSAGRIMAEVLRQDPERVRNGILRYTGVDPDLSVADAETISAGIGEAWASGELTAAEIPDIVENLGPETTEDVIALLALHPEHTQTGGVVEAFGDAAADLATRTSGETQAAWERASTLAYASSTELMEAHIPPGERDAAVDRLWGDREDFEKDYLIQSVAGRTSSRTAEILGAETLAAVLRLSADAGTGLTTAERNQLIEDLGPEATRELAYRLTDAGDGEVGGALETLMFSANTLRGRGQDAEAWQLTADIAASMSPALIQRHLGNPGEAAEAAERLAGHLAAIEDEAWDHYDADQIHRPSRIAADALSRIVAEDPNGVFDAYLIEGAGQIDRAAELAGLLQRTVFSPHADAETRARIEGAMGAYVDDAVQTLGPDAAREGANIGHLYAALQTAAEGAVADAQSRGGDAAFAGAVMSRMFGKLAAHAAKSLGPAGPYIGMGAESVFRELFDPLVDISVIEARLADDFLAHLEANGGNISAASDFMLTVNDIYEERVRLLNEELAQPNLDPDRRAEIQAELNRTMQLYGALNDGYLLYLRDGRLSGG